MPAALWQIYHSDKLVEWFIGKEPKRLLLPELPRPRLVCPCTCDPVDDGVGVGDGEQD